MYSKLRLTGSGGKQLRPWRGRANVASEGRPIAKSRIVPASAAVRLVRAMDPHEDASVREAARRLAISLVRDGRTSARRRTATEVATSAAQVAVGHTVYRVRGELMEWRELPPVVLVVAERDPHALPSNRDITDAYGLTPAETRVALMLAAELSSRGIARELGVTVHTVRRQTEQVLRKLGLSQRNQVLHELLQLARRIREARHRRQTRAGAAGDPRAGQAASPPRAGEGLASRKTKETIVAHLTNARDREVIAHALHGEVDLHFVEQPRDLRGPWGGVAPSAVLVELESEMRSEVEDALGQLRRREPAIPIWGFAPIAISTMLDIARLATRNIITEVITVHDDIASQARALLGKSRGRREAAALRGVWEPLVEGEAGDIVMACIDASTSARTVRDIARQLNRSPRTLRWQASRSGLPSVHRLLLLCRLLRAMHRLDEHGQIKNIVRELEYASAHAMEMQLQRRTGLHISEMREGGRFAELVSYIEAEDIASRHRRTQRREAVRKRGFREHCRK